MKNSIAYRKGIVLILATVCWVFGLQGVGYSQDDLGTDTELSVNYIYDKVIRSVTWIVANDRQGSGVLINRDLRIVVTNHHVTQDHESVVVYFPVRDWKGDLITDRQFYLDNSEILTQLGYATLGRIIAIEPENDLAIVQLSGLPETAREVEYSFSQPAHLDMNRNDLVQIFGNPGDLRLWRWTLGAFQRVEQEMLLINADIYEGNSGGPVVNDRGMLVGIATLSNQSTDTWAIPIQFIRDLLNTLRPRQIFSIQNKTGFTLHYQIKWTEENEWKNTVVKQGNTMTHWYTGSSENIPNDYPKIRFDYDASDSEFTPRIYPLKTYTRNLGSGVPPNSSPRCSRVPFRVQSFHKGTRSLRFRKKNEMGFLV